MYLVREHRQLEFECGVVNCDQMRNELGLVGGIRYTLITPTLSTTSSAASQNTASIAVSPAADLDNALYRHGEWHIHVHTTASLVSGTDANFGFEQKANQITAEDRTAEDTAIILPSAGRTVCGRPQIEQAGSVQAAVESRCFAGQSTRSTPCSATQSSFSIGTT